MAPVTEIVLHTLKPDADVESFYSAFSIIKEKSSARAIRASTVHEHPEQVGIFMDWDSAEAHHAFRTREAASYNAFLDAARPHCAKLPPLLFHAQLAPFPPAVLDNAGGKGRTPVAQVLFMYFAPDADADGAETLARAQNFVAKLVGGEFAGLTGESSLGWSVERDVDYKGEKARVLVVILGWESVQAHLEVRETDAWKDAVGEFRGAVEGFKGYEAFHVTTKDL
ncbi:uncharacterized protein F4812DRAFT_446399 [Daldinia caldariorum]|uniref:uncharacterized protein n=1 Tax=Daldinia caldariorum TaxID=326644 RepID=UPI0020085E9B|nr:uncharacterized protein F4812DRAFT_446399 [Daldinia caldariorum]KAI1463516.1 hypothetical protein F4812DRAFT_446399 [Daldinia caldariorum]